MVKKIFLEINGDFCIDGYRLLYFCYNEKNASQIPKSWQIRENIDFMKKNDFKKIYYEVDVSNGNNCKYIMSVKNKPNGNNQFLKVKSTNRRANELILIIDNKEKIENLIEYIIKDGLAKSYEKIKCLLEIISAHKNIMNVLVFKYINKICDRYNFHDKNNVKYFEVLLMNHLPPERIIFDAQGI